METKVMSPRPVEFILSEGNGAISRENGIVKEGQTLKPGEIVQLDGTKLVAFAGEVDSTSDEYDPPPVGVVLAATDASEADQAAAYLARAAEVKGDLIVYPADSDHVVVNAALAKLGIIVR